jgi:hypothetical protein
MYFWNQRIIKNSLTRLLFCCSVHIAGCSESPGDPVPETTCTPKENVWVFLMAGQSNMAGRGAIEAQDLVTDPRILSIDEQGAWITAKEPLHFYEPAGAGLDCGMSFARELLQYVPDSVCIAMIPCAVGGSSVYQWLGDSVHRGVQLLTNFKQKVQISTGKGVIKAVLWHQGERNANADDIASYKEALNNLFFKFRTLTARHDLPIIMGELGRFAEPPEKQSYFNDINDIIHSVAGEDPHIYYISSEGLTDKGDNLHFDARSQRELGRRYAQKYKECLL